MEPGEYSNNEKRQILELMLSKVGSRNYPAALTYATQVLHTQSDLTKSEAIACICATHRKSPDVVISDLASLAH